MLIQVCLFNRFERENSCSFRGGRGAAEQNGQAAGFLALDAAWSKKVANPVKKANPLNRKKIEFNGVACLKQQLLPVMRVRKAIRLQSKTQRSDNTK